MTGSAADHHHNSAQRPEQGAQRSSRQQRRDAAKRHHPDRGGDPAAFIRAVHGIPDTGSVGSTPARQAVTVRTTWLSRTARTLSITGRRLVREARHHLPRSFPGSRRYGHL